MLNVTPLRGDHQDADKLEHYMLDEDDYYTKEEIGEWQGKGAGVLGLAGAIEKEQFASLLKGQLPNGERIQATFDPTDHKKRMGLDLTFSAPKSVSMQALAAGDSSVTIAHDKAVARALDQVERLAEARKKIKGKSYRERTGNLVIAKFRHEMSRAKDPQLHTHAVVLNMTQRADGQWRALSNEDIFRVQHEIDAIYKAELAKELQALGYEIRLTNDAGAFELAHITREQIEAFSARSQVIEEALANQGKTRATASTLEKQIIALATRPRKDEADRELIKQYWVEKSRSLGIDYGARSRLDGRLYQPGDGRSASTSKQAIAQRLPNQLTPAQVVVQYAINHLTEREAVVKESKLMATALQRAVGLADTDAVRREIQRLVKQGTLIEAAPAYRLAEKKSGKALSVSEWKTYLQTLKGWTDREANQYIKHAIAQGSLVETEKRYTTQKALQREKAILAIERTGRGAVMPIVAAALVKEALARTTLNEGQRLAVEAIVSSPNRFVGIQGDAGTGKTYSIETAIDLIRQSRHMADGAGWRTVALAPYGNQVKALKNQGLEAHTLAGFLRTKDKPIDGKTIIVLDEAGVVGARQMEQVMRIVEKHGARMVLVGDTKQTQAIEAGKPFAQLQQEGMQVARIHEIQRQKDPMLKRAVEYAANSKVDESLAHIKHIEEIKEPNARHRAMVADYMTIAEAERRDTLIVAGTNEARREINGMVRDALDLIGKGKQFDTLTRVDMTEAQRRYAPSFQPGMVIQPEKDYAKAGLVRGETYVIKEALPGNVLTLERPDKTTTEINPRNATKLSVYKLERNELSVGDTIRINRNDTRLDLTNGDRMQVVGIHGHVVQLESLETKAGKPARAVGLLGDKPLHLEHAYASTVHSAQGLTSHRVLIDLDTQSRTTSMNLYYVAVSRPRAEARIYTNSAEELPAAIARRFDKTTALAVQREREMQRLTRTMQRQGVAGGKAIERQQPEYQQERGTSL